MKIQINKDQFLNFLEAVQKINDIFILDINDAGECGVVNMTTDETCFLYATTQIENGNKCTLNIPDCRKLSRALKQVNTDTIELNHTSNALKYSSKQTRFTYHLYDSDFLKRSKINSEKITSFQYDIELHIKKEDVKNLIKNASFVDQANKLYIYTENNDLYGEITDRQRANTDSVSLLIKEGVSFTLDPLIIKLDNLQLLHLCSDDITLKINTKYKLITFEVQTENNKFIYVLTSLKQ